PGRKRSPMLPSAELAPGEIPPSVMAISNLRCPSPPPILNNGSARSINVQPLLSASQLRETIPAGGAFPNHKENFPGTSPAVSPNINVGHFGNDSVTSLDYALNPPKKGHHHKVPSVHAHFFVDEAIKPGKIRSRSGSNSAISDSLISAAPSRLISEVQSVASPKQSGNENPVTSSGLIEQNANIDPRLPQDDGKLHVLLGVCGALSTAKIKLIIGKLFEIYTPEKISIQLILTKSSENFLSQETLSHLEQAKKVRIWRDSDEWSTWRTRLDPVLHIELRRWADILIVCPLTANTLSKITLGLCDNLLTNVIRAWNTSYPILLAPSMVSYSYNAITTKRQLRLIADEMPWIEILKPVEKVVGSYGDIGMGGMMDYNEIVNRIVLKLGGYPEEEDDEDDNEDEKVVDENDDDDDEDDDDEDDEEDTEDD
ncbi:flavo protein-domain-containing protein, partial [Suhomyces tanzawaensis NRRL Y-17324]